MKQPIVDEETVQDDDNTFVHTKAAIEAITGQDFEISTPPLSAPPDRNSGLWISPPSIHLESLTEEDENEQPVTLSSAIPTSTTTLPSYNRLHSIGTFNKYSLDATKLPGLYRSISAQPVARSNNMFGHSIQDVEKVLYRMANAIKKDLQLV